MITFLTRFNIITVSQHDFREGRFTQTATFSSVNFVYKKLDDGLFFDLSRAFDVISSKFIQNELYNISFRGVFLDWVFAS